MRDFLKEYFKEHSSSGSGRLRFQHNDLKDSPVDGEPEEQMAKELSQVSNFIDLKFEDGIVMIDKSLDEEFLVQIINGAEPFGEESKKVLINPFHHTALHNHINKFMLVPLGDVHLEQFVGALLEVNCRLNDQVNCAAQVDQVLLCEVVDLLLLLLLLHALLFFKHLLFVVVYLFQVDDVLFAQDLQLDGVPFFFRFLVKWVEFKHVQAFLPRQLLLEVHVVCDLLLCFHQVQLWDYPRVLLETRLANCEQTFN